MSFSERFSGFLFRVLFFAFSMILAHNPVFAESATAQKSDQPIVVVIHCEYSPVSFWNRTTDTPSGFFVDIMNHLAVQTGLHVSYICRNSWDEIATAIDNGDAGLGALMKSKQREQKVLFSTPIETTYLSFFARAQSDIDPEKAPSGQTIGVIKGSMSFEQLKDRPGVQLQIYESYRDGLFGLLAGEISLFAGEDSMVLKQMREIRLEDRIKKIGKPFIERQRCLVVKKDNVRLLELMNGALRDFMHSPQYELIYLKWYGAPAPFWTNKKVLTMGGVFLLVIVGGMAFWRYVSLSRINTELTRTINERKKANDALLESEGKYHTLFEGSADGILIADIETKMFKYANPAICRMFGYSEEELRKMGMKDIHPQADMTRVIAEFEAQARGDIVIAANTPCRRKDGTIFYADISAVKNTIDGRACNVGFFRDVTERKRVADAMVNNEKRLNDAQKTAHTGDWEWELATNNVHWSDELYRIYGYEPRSLAPDYGLVLAQMHPASKDEFVQAIDDALNKDRPFEMDYWFFRKDGAEANLHTIGQVIRDASGAPVRMLGIVQDVTERKKAEELIHRSLKEKAVLLKEIHHRVKNNMQVIYSLLNLQAKGIADPTVRALIEEARNRVHSMALIHEKLYGSEDLAHIDFKEYLRSLVGSIADTYKRHDVDFSVNMEQLTLDVNVGIPCGLIVNELVSNSLKYAFPDGRKGTITLGINKNSEGRYVLTVADNGVGFSPAVDFRNTPSLGLQLVNVLTKQISGTIELSNEGGTRFTITFPGTSITKEKQNG